MKQEYSEKILQHAQQALSLIDALEGKKGGRIHQELLLLDACNDLRLFGEWKVKSLYMIAYIYYTKYDRVEDAMATIQKARDVIIATMTKSISTKEDQTHEQQLHAVKIQAQLRKKERELIKLYHQCKERQKELLTIEKLRAQAMFAPSKTSTLSLSKPTTPGSTSSPPVVHTRPDGSSITKNGTVTTPPPTTTKTSGIQPPSSSGVSTKTTLGMEHEISNGMNVSSFHRHFTKDTGDHPIKHDDDDITNEVSDDTTTVHRNVDRYHHRTTTTSNNNDADLPWHHDPFVLTGLGVIIGTIGTLLVLSQVILPPTASIKR